MVEFTNPFSNKKKNKVNTEDNLVIDSSIESLADNPPAENNNEITLENVAEEALKDNTPLSQPIVNQSQTSNLPRLPKIAPADDRAFAELFEEGDNEESELYRAKQETNFGESYKKEVEDKIIELIERNINDLKKKYPTGGIKASRYITTEVLIMAPAGYFDKYLNDVSRGVDYVRNKLADADKSDMIRTAQDNPTDDALQDRAFFLVHSLASEFMKNSMWRETNRSIVVSFICNEIVGFGRIDPLWRDRSIDEIMCNGPKDIQIEIRGEITKVPGCYFNNQAHLMELIDRLYGAIGKTVSMTTAMVKGRLHDKSRMYATHPVISPDGPNFSIRRHPEKFWAPSDLVQRGSASPEMMSYIGNLIYKGASVAITGGTHSGKEMVAETKVHTPSGITTMGEIQIGDQIFDHHGNIATVTNKFPQPLRQVYEISFSNGEKSYVGANHNWFISTHESRKSNKYRESNKKNSGWTRKTNYSPEIIDKIEKKLIEVSENDYVSFAEGFRNVGLKTTGSKHLTKQLKSLAKINRKVLAKDFYKTLLEYGKKNKNDQRHRRSPLFSVMTTEEMMNVGLLHKSSVDGHKRYNFHIPVLENAVEYDNGKSPEDLPIHPYLFGLWLGDGSSSKAVLTGAADDVEFYNNYFNYAPETKIFKTIGKSDSNWKITVLNFRNNLLELGVVQKTTAEGSKKHIPDIYKYASVESRRMLIAGLIDSDGWANTRCPGWIFTNTNETLVKDYIQVASSLAYKVSRSKDKQKYFDYKGEKKAGKTSWDVSIVTHDSLAYLPRKIEAHKKMLKQFPESLGRQDDISIVDIKPVEGRIENMVCITVDSPDSTYMIENSFITTHNTSLLNALTGFYKPRVRILTLEDNIEMKPNPKKYLAAAMECRAPAVDRPSDKGVSMRDLVKGSLQLRPDAIIVGEVTDDAAFDLCQALNTGHAGMSTIHANSSIEAIPRIASLIAQGGLVTSEGSLELISSAFDIVVSVKHFPLDGSRRIVSVDEVGSTPVEINGRLTLPVYPLWKFIDEGLNAEGKVIGHWEQVGDISKERQERKLLNIEESLNWEDLKELSSIPGQE